MCVCELCPQLYVSDHAILCVRDWVVAGSDGTTDAVAVADAGGGEDHDVDDDHSEDHDVDDDHDREDHDVDDDHDRDDHDGDGGGGGGDAWAGGGMATTHECNFVVVAYPRKRRDGGHECWIVTTSELEHSCALDANIASFRMKGNMSQKDLIAAHVPDPVAGVGARRGAYASVMAASAAKLGFTPSMTVMYNARREVQNAARGELDDYTYVPPL